MDETVTLEQLNFREIREQDAIILHEVLSDREHMRHTFSTNSFNDRKVHFRRLSNQWKQLGYGAWCITKVDSDSPIGWGGIIVDNEEPGWGPELVYFLHPDETGKGYGFEIGMKALQYAFHDLKLDKLAAFAMKENKASCGLLEKLGFRYVRYIDSLSRNYYEIHSLNY